MCRIELDGTWELRYWPEGERIIRGPEELASTGIVSIPAQVPGNVELDLQRAGIIGDPFVADNILALRPFEFCEWWYTRSFDVPADAGADWELVFAGLDTMATVWVNDVEAGRSDNMLIEHRFDAGHALLPGQTNQIAVRIGSALREAQRHTHDASTLSWEHREEGVTIRKAPHMWGWDIMPRAVSAGIWRSVWLEQRMPNAVEQLYFWTVRVSSEAATLGVRYEVRTDRFGPNSNLRLRFHGACDGSTFDCEWPLEFTAGGTTIDIPHPHLWWPKGYGKASLYQVNVQLLDGNEVIAERTERVGLRTVEVDRTEKADPPWTPGSAGESVARIDRKPAPDAHFVFRVNGLPIMVKGSNWVPLDAFHSRDTQRYSEAVALFDDLGCNMIRCWGGNVYEDHAFFDLCDEKGILVWQDFAFACCRYPQDEAFLGRVRAEAESVVRKLRNHASLALWCGDNEIDGCYTSDGLNPEHNRITREVLAQVVHRCDPYRHYVPSSPYAPDGGANGLPEQHLWGPRNYYKSPYYTHHNAHFIGEMGYHGCPNASSIRRFISQEHVWPWQDNREWRIHDVTHSKHRADRDRIKLMANQIRELFGEVPETLEDFALASQIVQAEAKKFFVESTRLRKWSTSGVLWWNVIDGWPQFSDAIVDYYFGKKLAYHYLRRVQTPVCVIMGESGSEKYLPVVVSNDSRGIVGITFRVWDADTDETLATGTFTSPPNENWQVARIRTYASARRLLLIEWTLQGDVWSKCGNHYLVGPPPHSLEQYRTWLGKIAALDRTFDAEATGR